LRVTELALVVQHPHVLGHDEAPDAHHPDPSPIVPSRSSIAHWTCRLPCTNIAAPSRTSAHCATTTSHSERIPRMRNPGARAGPSGNLAAQCPSNSVNNWPSFHAAMLNQLFARRHDRPGDQEALGGQRNL
jgi:hypothetical protein